MIGECAADMLNEKMALGTGGRGRAVGASSPVIGCLEASPAQSTSAQRYAKMAQAVAKPEGSSR